MVDNGRVKGFKNEGIKNLANFGEFDSDSITAIFKSMCSDNMVLSGILLITIKRAYNFSKYLSVTERKFRKTHMTAETLKYHAISWKAIKDKSKDASISIMRKNGNILVWLDSIEKELWNIIGH